MKSIKQLAFSAALTIGAFGAVFYTSCNKDECKDVVCQNSGTCNSDDGSCTCATGFEGTNCETKSRDKFVGIFVGSEACTTGTDNYSVTLAANSDDVKLTMSNIYNNTPPYTATCTMAAVDSFSFTGSQSPVTFSGTGRLTGNTLTVRYTITDGTNSNSCVFTGTK